VIPLGELLGVVRRRAGLSQDDLARRAGTSGPTVAAYERGRKEPRWSTFARLVDAGGATATVTIIPNVAAQGLTRSERQSLALHQAVLLRLLADPDGVRSRARVNLSTMERAAPAAAPYLRRWSTLLDGPLGELTLALVATDEEARDLRQNSPFAGVLSASERESALASARE
jgi:transcriptional regulator with XRE-family HTH domain